MLLLCLRVGGMHPLRLPRGIGIDEGRIRLLHQQRCRLLIRILILIRRMMIETEIEKGIGIDELLLLSLLLLL